MLSRIIVLFLVLNVSLLSAGNDYYDLVIAKDGTGDYTSLTEAFGNLPMYNYERFVIFVKNGIYEERIRIERDYITIIGESRDSTIIQFSLLRSDWDANKDFIGNAVINIYADDVVLKNLTIKNTQPEVGPHAFAIYGTGTRTIILNCNVMSNGADTVSLWNYKEGMYYHADCYFEGSVDFVCPRGWCYIEDSKFYELKPTATIWHAATINPDQKFVIRNSYFDGVDGFQLGRHHYEAMFFLLDCKFSGNMSDQPIYRVTYKDNPERNRPYIYGERKYFYNCTKEGEQFVWYNDNLYSYSPGLSPNKITAKWTFDGKWDPENVEPPQIIDWKYESNKLYLYFNELLSIHGEPVLTSSEGIKYIFSEGHGRDVLVFSGDKAPAGDELFVISDGELIASVASVSERKVTNRIVLTKD